MNFVIAIGLVIAGATLIPVFLQIKSHPKGLFILFAAEMWERFSYYGMRALLIFYLTQHFLFDDEKASLQYGTYTSLVYLLPLLGGVIADNFLGMRKAIAFGALLLVIGHSTMAIEGQPATQTLTFEDQTYTFVAKGRGDNISSNLVVDGNEYKWKANNKGDIIVKNLPDNASIPSILPSNKYKLAVVDNTPIYKKIFYLALCFIVLGVGFLKGNISSIVGQLYKENDVRRDSGYTLYYYGINLGSFLSVLLCGYLGEKVGWWAGFGLAGVGMALGLVVFVLGKPLLQGVGEPPKKANLTRKKEYGIYIFSLLAIAPIYFILNRPELNQTMLLVFTVAIFGYIFYHMRKMTKEQVQQLTLALILIAFSVVFWMLFEQAGSSLNQFAARNTQLPDDGGGFFTMTATQVQSFNAGFILMLAPLFSYIWAKLGTMKKDPNTPMKFGFAILQVGIGFIILTWGANFADESFKVPLIFLAVAYLFHTTGELCLSPVGLSMVSKLSPKTVLSTMMAIWFLSSSWALSLAGQIAKLTATETIAGQVLNAENSLNTSIDIFWKIGIFGIIIGILVLLLSPVLKKLGHGKVG